MKHLTIVTLSAALLAGCASQGVDPLEKNVTINISYGIIKEKEAVTLKSDAGKNAAVGGLWGLLAGSGGNSGDMAGGAAAGALVMGLTTKIMEGSRDADSYVIARKDGSTFKVITDDKTLHVDDCVAVETGKTTNIRAVSEALCGSPADKKTEEQIDKKMDGDAAACHLAKDSLLKAETEAQIDGELKKIKVFCH